MIAAITVPSLQYVASEQLPALLPDGTASNVTVVQKAAKTQSNSTEEGENSPQLGFVFQVIFLEILYPWVTSPFFTTTIWDNMSLFKLFPNIFHKQIQVQHIFFACGE